MSSEISIEEGRLKPAPTGNPPVEAGFRRPDNGFRTWHFFVLASILLATVGVIVARRSSPEHLVLLSLTIGATGAVAAALYAMLRPFATPGSAEVEEPLSERRRAALIREKALTLRAIKELEFDRAMGKLSQKDFDEMAGRLRQRALGLMRHLDEGVQYRDVIEQDLRQRIGVPPKPDTAITSCACGTGNDTDAIFCKKCGTRLPV